MIEILNMVLVLQLLVFASLDMPRDFRGLAVS
jgi:hypothetical protein